MKKSRYAVVGVLVAVAAGMAVPGTASAATSPVSLDTSFGTNGVTTSSLDFLTGDVTNAAVESDGDIVVLGSFGLARFLPTGQPDPSFGTDGVVSGIDPNAVGLAIQPDGKIITAGTEVVRYNADGTLDTTFGDDTTLEAEDGVTGGIAAIPPIPLPGAEGSGLGSGLATSVLVQPDGAILVSGGAEAPAGRRESVSDGYVVRYTSDGTPDTSFGASGVAIDTTAAQVTALALDSAGDIFGLPDVGVSPEPPEIELSSSGAVDATVTPEPLAAQSIGADDPAFAPSGGYLVPTDAPQQLRHTFDAVVNQYTAAGALAATTGDFVFGGTSGAVADEADQAIALPSGQTLIVGTHNVFPSTDTSVGLAEVTPAGTLNTSFGTGGATLAPSSVGQGFPLLETDGTLIIIGTTEIPSADTVSGTTEALTLTRLNL